MPPFSALTTDEEREMKAELTEPGKYFVVANPKSFELLPEYRDSSISEVDPAQVLHQSSQIGPAEGSSRVLSGSGTQDLEDPDMIILRTFEEPVRRGSTQLPIIPRTPPSPYLYPLLDHSRELLEPNAPSLQSARTGGKDLEFRLHYRTAISHHMAERIGDEDVFEIQARNYPPVSRELAIQQDLINTEQLFHAMMALAALSLAHKNGSRSRNTDALEHYQQVIPALKTMVQSSQDSFSDGPLLTHTLLLLYEVIRGFGVQVEPLGLQLLAFFSQETDCRQIAAAERESNMWQHHIDQLLRIVTLRRQSQSNETYDFVVSSLSLGINTVSRSPSLNRA